MVGLALSLFLITHEPVKEVIAYTATSVMSVSQPNVVYIKVDPAKRKRLCH